MTNPIQCPDCVYPCSDLPGVPVPLHAPAGLDGVVLGRQRLGVNVLSLVATLREEARMPFRTSQRYLDTVHQLRVSEGASVGAIRQTAQKAQPMVAGILDRVQASPVVHADETGWRQDGNNGYVGTFSTPTERYFLRRGRGKTVVDEALSDDFSGLLVSDFYAAYHHYDGPKQRCWAHPCSSQGQALLRDIHDLRTRYPDDAPLTRWADVVHGIYDRAKACTHPQAKRRRTAQLALERQLLALCQPFRHDTVGNPGQAVPTHRAPHQGTLRLCGRTRSAFRQQRRRAQPAPSGHQPQGQRRHPLGAGHREQDDAGIHLRHLARPSSKSPHRLPSTAHFPATLNCYLSLSHQDTMRSLKLFGKEVIPALKE